jgi:hypothetical protein
MMGRALLVIGLLATIVLVVTGALGYGMSGPADERLRFHVLAALAASLLLIFAHCWILLYLIVIGRAIRSALAESGLELPEAVVAERFKSRSFPMLLLALGLAIATFVSGGAAASGNFQMLHANALHHVLFYATLIAQLRALQLERQVLVEHDRLIADVNRRITAAAT